VRRIIGVDPGLASTGWGLVDYCDSRLHCAGYGCIETPPDMPRGERLKSIHGGLAEVIRRFGPGEAAIETLYFARNKATAMPVAEARGVCLLCLAQGGLEIGEFSPNAIKKAVAGVAGADKAQVQEMVRFLLSLREVPQPDHAADALAAAICRAHSLSL
jgi:crossover junction endodeoxyribonuclease RuvC